MTSTLRLQMFGERDMFWQYERWATNCFRWCFQFSWTFSNFNEYSKKQEHIFYFHFCKIHQQKLYHFPLSKDLPLVPPFYLNCFIQWVIREILDQKVKQKRKLWTLFQEHCFSRWQGVNYKLAWSVNYKCLCIMQLNEQI